MPRSIISASRRTDIPAFYMPWFMASIEAGRFEVQNPYNNRVSTVPVTVADVHSIVFWSKNFGPFLDQGYGKSLAAHGYRLFFNFTINSPHALLEPNLPPLNQRLNQLERLAEAFGPECIQWRFDPICFFREPAGPMGHNLDHFDAIAAHAARLGLRICITSFADLYRKVLRRADALGRLQFIDPPMPQKVAVITRLAESLAGLNIQLRLCCEKALLEALPPALPVAGAACIPGRRLADLFGADISLAKDSGQRRSAGCNCSLSKDIGSYKWHPCPHNCLFCYANPEVDGNFEKPK